MMVRWVIAVLCLIFSVRAHADGPGDNVADKVRPVPPPGVAIPDGERKELENGVAELGKEIDALRSSLNGKPLLDLLPDVQVYHNAVRYALAYNEFFNLKEVPVARTLLKQGMERAKQLRDGKAPWTSATGLVVRGYVSKIDGSVQPYGLVVPASYHPNTAHRHRLDLWWHGRGETLSEVNFIDQRQKSPGEFTPRDAFVLHPYGRYCNANKFAGEIDTLEAIAHVQKHYPIDEDRFVARGFSMGGAACWQFAVHYPGAWCAAAPGAGFSETPDFLKVFQKEDVKPTWYERKLWHLYDCTDYASNLFNCPTVAYSGEDDTQKQAADMMAKAMAKEGLRLVHIIGPKTGHRYHPQAREEINRRIDSIAQRGRDRVPDRVRFTTWTLRYNRNLWLRIDGLEYHWEQAIVDAEIAGGTVRVQTKNVSALSFVMPPGYCPLDSTRIPTVQLDGSPVAAAPVLSDRSWVTYFRKLEGKWQLVSSVDDGTLRKLHGLQGPIDDAFMDSFLMVRPTGKPMNDKVGSWASTEMKHAIDHWRKQFRGEARVKDDTTLSPADIAMNNLVLWGDPSSNQFLAKIAAQLPIRWDDKGVHVGDKAYDATHHVPVLIYPNPLNPRRYVVLNSGFTFREYDYLNNARQVPKLPDWAVIDVNVPPSSRAPGKIVDAAFFGERWELMPSREK
jgi:pimeloyl-ACP methyl ester carboxylesterase